MIDKLELIETLKDPEVARALHLYSDLNHAAKSQHHTLGKLVNQAAPGTHTHDGDNSVKIPTGAVLLSECHLTSNSTNSNSTTSFTDIQGHTSTNNGPSTVASLLVMAPVKNGHRYRFTFDCNFNATSTNMQLDVTGVLVTSAGASGNYVGQLSGVCTQYYSSNTWQQFGLVTGYFYCQADGVVTLTPNFRRNPSSAAGTFNVGGQATCELWALDGN